MTIRPSLHVLIDPDFFEEGPIRDGLTEAIVLSVFRDTLGDCFVAFELADLGGVWVIGTGSNFFKGWVTA